MKSRYEGLTSFLYLFAVIHVVAALAALCAGAVFLVENRGAVREACPPVYSPVIIVALFGGCLYEFFIAACAVWMVSVLDLLERVAGGVSTQ